MNELEQAITGDSYAAPPAHIIEGLDEEAAHQRLPGVPRTIYDELWHIGFWQQISLDWIRGVDTLYPTHPADTFPCDAATETWSALCQRFLRTSAQAAALTRDDDALTRVIHCPARPGDPTRTMTVREQLESLAAHNAYHLGRIVLMRQLLGAWPPPSGGFTW